MPDYPEDLSFFKKGEVWLASSSHERECYLFPNQNESEKVMHIRGLAAAIEDE